MSDNAAPISLRGGQKALKKVLAPISKRILVARVLAMVAAVLAVAPYVALVELGNVWLNRRHIAR